MTAATIRILLAEDQAMVRGALAALLALEPDMEIVAEVARGDEVVAAALASQPDVALLDIEMPGADGLTAAAEVHAKLPACRILILTTFGRPGYLRRAMESGVVGFLLKDAPAAQLAAASHGASIAEIAAPLYLSEGTVRNYLSVAMRKLGAHNRVEAAHLAEQKGWL